MTRFGRFSRRSINDQAEPGTEAGLSAQQAGCSIAAAAGAHDLVDVETQRARVLEFGRDRALVQLRHALPNYKNDNHLRESFFNRSRFPVHSCGSSVDAVGSKIARR